MRDVITHKYAHRQLADVAQAAGGFFDCICMEMSEDRLALTWRVSRDFNG